MSETLLHILKADLDRFARALDTVLTNERDMQVRIAMYLRQQNYYDAVEVEYAVPLELIGYAKLSRRNTDFEGRKNNFP